MQDIDLYVAGTIFIRLTNWILWMVVSRRILMQDRPVSRLVRRLIVTVLFFGMLVLFLGSLTAVGIIAGPTARLMYTIYTAYSGLIALALVSGRDSTLGSDDHTIGNDPHTKDVHSR